VQVVDRDPLEVFSGCQWSIRDGVLVRPFIEEGLSRASCSVLTRVVERFDVLWWRVWLDVCIRKREGSTHVGWWVNLRSGTVILSNSSIVGDTMIAMPV
jgi:hypothetical protein